jgi:demethylmenaquinone methyltransferase/2-methoxy-6-polyprenyl-1,4-benzoquinol methylase
VGLQGIRAQTFVGDAHAPLSDRVREALVALFDMRWPNVEGELTGAALSAYRRLCLPESADFILDHPDYYCFFTYSMFHGKVDRLGDAVSRVRESSH